MRMANETSLWVTICQVIASKVPDNQRLVATTREQHVGAVMLVSNLTPKEMRTAYFSSEVAKLVTQPLWPSRVPRWISCSAMIDALEIQRPRSGKEGFGIEGRAMSFQLFGGNWEVIFHHKAG